jgi:tetratricopeptide (TPR) repeat protein
LAGDLKDPPRIVTALTDLGLARLKECDTERARRVLEEALAEAHRIGDVSLEMEALRALGQALRMLGRAGEDQEVLTAALAQARSTDDRYAEKAILDQLGQAQATRGDHAAACASFERALARAAELSDHQHAADLLWLIGIQKAELGRRDQAIASAQRSVDLLQRHTDPRAGWFAQHLTAFQSAPMCASLAAPPGSFSSQVLDASTRGGASPPGAGTKPAPPGLLRMALDATEAMIRFVGSGFKTAPEAIYRERLQICSTCTHHTGLRCRICGCFTGVKAKLQHEACPAGRWPR